MDEISLERGEEFSTTRNPEQKRSKIPITSLNYSKDSITEMEHVFKKFGTQSKTFLQQGPGADMEQLIKKFRTQPTKILKHRPQYKFGTWICEAWNSKQKLFPNKDPSTDMEQEFKKFGTLNKDPSTDTVCNTVMIPGHTWNRYSRSLEQSQNIYQTTTPVRKQNRNSRSLEHSTKFPNKDHSTDTVCNTVMIPGYTWNSYSRSLEHSQNISEARTTVQIWN